MLSFVCFLDSGEVMSFGWNGNGQLGIGSTQQQTTPVVLSSLKQDKVVSVIAGRAHSLCLLGNVCITHAYARASTLMVIIRQWTSEVMGFRDEG